MHRDPKNLIFGFQNLSFIDFQNLGFNPSLWLPSLKNLRSITFPRYWPGSAQQLKITVYYSSFQYPAWPIDWVYQVQVVQNEILNWLFIALENRTLFEKKFTIIFCSINQFLWISQSHIIWTCKRLHIKCKIKTSRRSPLKDSRKTCRLKGMN